MPETEDLLVAEDGPFATGSASYLDAHPELVEPLARIYVEFLPQGSELAFLALLDTGGHYCILSPAVVDLIGDHLTDHLGPADLRTAHGVVAGELYKHGITLIAKRGRPLEIDATVFVSADWQGPCFLGYAGVLERLRFAVDPYANRFFFGPLP